MNIKYTRIAITAICLGFVLLYIIIAVMHLSYPFELEWMEGGTVMHVQRILEGKQVYTQPNIEFIAYIYTPLYYYISALIAAITGLGFFPLRLISFISSLLTFFLIYKIVSKETEDKFAGIVSAGLYASCYQLCGFWFDIARNDSLFLFFILLFIYFIHFGRNGFSFLLAGVFVWLAFFTKQSSILIAAPVFLYLLIYNRKKFYWSFASFAALTVASVIIMNNITGGWFTFYTFELLNNHGWKYTQIVSFLLRETIKPFFISIILGLFFIFSLYKHDKKDALFFLSFISGALLYSFSGRLHLGGYLNLMMPTYAVFAILLGIGFVSATNIISYNHEQNYDLTKTIFSYIVLAQLLFMIYNPLDALPKPGDMKAGQNYVKKLTDLKGNVFVERQSYIPLMAGKQSYAPSMAAYDLVRGNVYWGGKYLVELSSLIEKKKFDVIITNETTSIPNLEKYYFKEGSIFSNEDEFYPVAGNKTRPQNIYTPK